MMRRSSGWRFAASALAVVGALWGCAETTLVTHVVKSAASDNQPPPSSTAGAVYKIGKPYQVAGVWYYPREDFDYDESGIASWYGPDFHGKLTANGEVFDQNAVTAAHKTLPLPSVVRVTNLENGRSVIVRINDRGPFVNGRIIDLSRRSAQLLGMEGKGTAKVRVQILGDESRALASRLKNDAPGSEPPVSAAPRERVVAETLAPPPGTKAAKPSSKTQPAAATGTPPPPTTLDQRIDAAANAAESRIGQVAEGPPRPSNIYVQAGTFSKPDNADKLKAALSSLGRVTVQHVIIKGQGLYRVRLGPVSSPEDADGLLDKVIANGHQDARVVVD